MTESTLLFLLFCFGLLFILIFTVMIAFFYSYVAQKKSFSNLKHKEYLLDSANNLYIKHNLSGPAVSTVFTGFGLFILLYMGWLQTNITYYINAFLLLIFSLVINLIYKKFKVYIRSKNNI